MTDFNFDPNTMTRAYAQRKALTEEENVRPKAIPKGIASKPDDGNTDTSSDEPDFYDKMLDELLGYFSSEDDADKVFSDKTPDRQDTQTSYEAMFGGLSQETLDAVEQSKQKRMGPADIGDVDVVEEEVITESLKESGGATPENTQLRLATQSAGLMSASKDGEVSAPMTAEAKGIVKAEIGISSTMWDAYREEISAIESGGKENPYTIKGGANKHYDGMYQLGKVAKQDAAELLGITLGHTAQEREAYRNDPKLQEKAFAAYTAKNHSYLINKSERYKMLPLKEKLAVLGYAHNQGWSGADTWLETGKTGKDAFGTKGTKYYNALIDRLKL